jgi:hypothetical protein
MGSFSFGVLVGVGDMVVIAVLGGFGGDMASGLLSSEARAKYVMCACAWGFHWVEVVVMWHRISLPKLSVIFIFIEKSGRGRLERS